MIELRSDSSSYTMPVMLSVVMHAVLLLLLIVGLPKSQPKPAKAMPKYVEAKLLSMDSATMKQLSTPKPSAPPQPKEQKPVPAPVKPVKPTVDETVKKREEEKKQEQQRKAEEQKKREAQQKIEKEKQQKLEQEKKRKVEEDKKRKQAEEKKRQEQEKAKKEQQRKEQEKLAQQKREKERLERERQEKLKREKTERERREREAAMAKALEDESELIEAAKSGAETQSYIAAIAQRIERNWSRPPSARKGMTCELIIQLIPTGEVVDVSVSRSSGSDAFDRAAVQAVQKVGQFTELKDMPSHQFESNFRRFRLVFDPRDLRL